MTVPFLSHLFFRQHFLFLLGILATPLRERFGARTVLTISGLVAGSSMAVASFLPSLYATTSVFVVVTGELIHVNKQLVQTNLIG